MDQDYEPTRTRSTDDPQTLIPQPTAARRSFGPGILAAVGIVALSAGFGIGWASHTSSKSSAGDGALVTVHGTLQLAEEANFDAAGGVNCHGTGGYSDISGGVAVTIGDQTGKTLAISRLDTGHPVGPDCAFTFAAQIPAGATLYTVMISHRGTQTFTPADIAGGFNLSLGS